MDLGDYIAKSNRSSKIDNTMKNCRVCGRELDPLNKDFYYFQRFCSEKCFERYKGNSDF